MLIQAVAQDFLLAVPDFYVLCSNLSLGLGDV